MKNGEPISIAEWQEATDLAELYLLIDSARQYGLITGGPTINVERCLQILSTAKRRGITPSPDAIDRWAKTLRAKSQQHG